MILVYVKNISPRIKYTAKFIFGEVLGIKYQLIPDIYNIQSSGMPVINYSDEDLPGAFVIKPAGLMDSGEIRHEIDPELSVVDGIKYLFPVKSDLGFDIFSAVFYMISRYEEYGNREKDRHGRFQAKNSLAFREGFIREPIVNKWIVGFGKKLKMKFPALSIPELKKDYLITMDIDNPWAHKHKGLFRLLAGSLKFVIKGKSAILGERIKVLFLAKQDPYDCYDFIFQQNEKMKVFILVGSKSSFDNRFKIRNKHWLKLIRKIYDHSGIGLHPSYYSNSHPGELKEEKKVLEKITNSKINSGRQHYLVLDLPGTYQQLEAAGIKEDYSMGYAEVAGFRAGTSFPFNFYDLKLERESDLRIFPFCVMDRSLKDYLQLNTKQAETLVAELIEQIRQWGGLFIPVWHNESLGNSVEWKGWKSVYLEMQNEIQEKLKTQ